METAGAKSLGPQVAATRSGLLLDRDLGIGIHVALSETFTRVGGVSGISGPMVKPRELDRSP